MFTWGKWNTHHSPGWECLLPVLQREERKQEGHKAFSGKNFINKWTFLSKFIWPSDGCKFPQTRKRLQGQAGCLCLNQTKSTRGKGSCLLGRTRKKSKFTNGFQRRRETEFQLWYQQTSRGLCLLPWTDPTSISSDKQLSRQCSHCPWYTTPSLIRCLCCSSTYLPSFQK